MSQKNETTEAVTPLHRDETATRATEDAAAKGATFATVARHAKASDALRDMTERMKAVSETYRATGVERTAGRVAEEWHAGTFNAAAAVKGRPDLAAHTTASAGQPTAAADLLVTKSKKVVAEIQAKYTETTARTTFGLADPAYDGMQKLHPADQKVASLARRRGASGTGGRHFPDTARNATDRVKAEGVESKPLTRQQALDAARDPANAARGEQLAQTAQAAKGAALTGGAVRGGLSALVNGKAVLAGEKDLEEAVVDVAIDTGKGAVEGATIALGAEAVAQTAVRAGAKSLARGSAPVAIAVTALDVGKDAVDLFRGEIDGGEFAGRTARNAAKGGTTWAGGEAGAAIGTLICPGVGTVVGGIIGGVAGALGGSWFFS